MDTEKCPQCGAELADDIIDTLRCLVCGYVDTSGTPPAALK